jgi:predicted CXXCH cytochrome family protein
MRAFVLALMVTALAVAPVRLPAQNIDSVASSQSRAPGSLADDIRDPAERAAFVALLGRQDPQKLLANARLFLDRYPRSAFLALAAEKAARSSFDLGNLPSGLDYARFSLKLYPENPLLLVAVADVEAQLQQNEAAMTSARDALTLFDRFDRPAAIKTRDWPAVKQKQQAIAWFVIGRALVNEGGASGSEHERQNLLAEAITSLLKARSLNTDDMEALYLLGVAHRSTQDVPHAVTEFAAVARSDAPFAPQAREQLTAMYRNAQATGSLEQFVAEQERQAKPLLQTSPVAAVTNPGVKTQPAYAGSEACGQCHADIHDAWSQSGMAKMLRPYQPQNVMGDFETNNEFYTGDDPVYENGKLKVVQGAKRELFARMILRNGRHYFSMRQADGQWHSYPVDYTIGSKWQQAYATKLPNGQIHVFPIQYNRLEKKWLNYWKVIDAPGTERTDPHSWEKMDDSTNYLVNCAVCHTSQLRNIRGGGYDADNLRFREPGINCEMCHGPSAAHVEAISSGKLYQKQPMEPPVAFQKIGNRDFVAVCAQCHRQSNLHAASPRGELNYATGESFLPRNAALPLDEFTRGAFFKDGRFKQTTFMVEALERSKCFRKGQASCGTCHNPHGHDEATNPTSLKFRDQPDLMCTGCHSQFQNKARAAAHTHHATDSEGSRCVSCHMPRIMDSMLFRARTHQIDDIPSAEMTARFGAQESPNACLLCHTEKSAQWVQGQLDGWKPVQRAAK